MKPNQPISTTPDGVRIRVHVQPRASRSEIAGLHGDAIKIRLAAPPVDGAANEALVELLATVLRVPLSAVALEQGSSSRRKAIRVTGVSVDQASRVLLHR